VHGAVHGAAVGAALTQSPIVALCIFAALGFGLALPYLSLSFAPWLRRALPKPGAWMDTLKQVFAFPMYASAAWLLWVLARSRLRRSAWAPRSRARF
jgi:thiol:disulfide interchange protein